MKTEFSILSALLLACAGCTSPTLSAHQADGNSRQNVTAAIVHDPAGAQLKTPNARHASDDSTQFVDLIDAFVRVFGGKPTGEPPAPISEPELVARQGR